jgi:phosphoglucosamine mutase
MGKYFGTDGIRGKTNDEPMTPQTVLRVGMAAGSHFTSGSHTHNVVIGKDTRLSGYMIEPALTAGFISVGMDVILIGPLPTPGVAMLTRNLRADLGVMISASHNPYEDNGIKLFGPDGYKLSDDVEAEIEARIDDVLSDKRVTPDRLGQARRLDNSKGRYIEFVKNTFPRGLTLDGLKIVLDCANGAAYRVAPSILSELGATVIPLGVSPDGFNINDACGSTAPQTMQAEVIANGADLGIALDGDADRVVITDEHGELLDGDQVMALVASYWHRAGKLIGGGVVATVMSNLGLERYLSGLGLLLHRTQVGDRYVVEHMRTSGLNVGGEQSGHIILSDFSTTGDGLIAALQALALIVELQKPVSEIGRVFEAVPQTLRNVRLPDRDGSRSKILNAPVVRDAVARSETRLGGEGRLLLRPSGTEPVIRVMAESDDEDLMNDVLDDIVAAIEQTVAPAAVAG